MTSHVTSIEIQTYTEQPVEIVERKGLGHPDTMCDALAEELSCQLGQFYLENFGLVLHHNVDKALLWGGISSPKYNGGSILAPIEVFLAGRATREYQGIQVPVEELMTESASRWIKSHFHALNPDRHIQFHCLIRPGSSELVELYQRQKQSGVALANDTSCGVGYAPLTELEHLVLHIEKYFNSREIKTLYPYLGEDIKVMGSRHNDQMELTIACAFIDHFITDLQDYIEKKSHFSSLVEQEAKSATNKPVIVSVNTADDIAAESIYLTVTGTSAESGDDGEVGRGNRVNGLITPYRPMNMEAAAGKNPVTHVGKIYNIVAQQIAETLVAQFGEIEQAYCYLLSQIGRPVNQPRIIDLCLYTRGKISRAKLDKEINVLVNNRLSEIPEIQQLLIERKINIY